MAPKPKPTTTTQPESKVAAEVGAAAKALSNDLGGTGSTGTTNSTPATPQEAEAARLGINKDNEALPVTFSLPSQTDDIPAPSGAATNAQGQRIATYAQVVAEFANLDEEQMHFFQSQMVNANELPAQYATGKYNQESYTLWKRVALDAANTKTSFSTLVNIGASSGEYATIVKGIKADISSAQEDQAKVTMAPATITDPNSIKQAVVAAYAANGEAAPSPQFLDSFVSAFQGAQENAPVSEYEQEKQGYGAALPGLQSNLSTVENANPTTPAQLQQLEASSAATGPVVGVSKASPNLDAEAMAQAKASNPAQYYATQTSYLYGILNQMLYGAPSYQTAPTAPSQTAPGGAVVGTPLVPTGG